LNPELRQQHQFKEIERQIQQAVLECGEKLVEMNAGFAELYAKAAKALD